MAKMYQEAKFIGSDYYTKDEVTTYNYYFISGDEVSSKGMYKKPSISTVRTEDEITLLRQAVEPVDCVISCDVIQTKTGAFMKYSFERIGNL